ncbi:META domain-containing protein [Algoriphagus boseongensis]|uniref:META domain-containing protein n=1 Tax=Algoriphagus boseongensis TaxID=1442587 RepID=A0A4R6TBL5_9BACT|nr:DUF4377 domain-containing protein [Algoriphagus boseongensis]TDQ18854.1 META domain-containing protein [Algoriphagus boseongensis]
MKTILLLLNLLLMATTCQKEQTEEFETEIWWINSARVDCVGVSQMTCFQIQKEAEWESGKWKLFYDAIEGFDYEPGFLYQIKVEVTKKKEPIPADASSLSYKLVEVISKKPDPRLALTNIWKVIYVGRFQDPKSSNKNEPLIFEFQGSEGTFFGNMGCNTVRGGFSIPGDSKILLGPGASTMMACPNMEVELDVQKALEKIRTYKIENRILYLMDEEGKNLMMLQAVD